MFGVGFSEIVFIVFIYLMLFGAKGIPEMARFLGKTMAQLRHASNEIKHEIQKSAKDNGIDLPSMTSGISTEIAKAKDEMNTVMNPLEFENPKLLEPIEKVKEDIENLTGPIKRQI